MCLLDSVSWTPVEMSWLQNEIPALFPRGGLGDPGGMADGHDGHQTALARGEHVPEEVSRAGLDGGGHPAAPQTPVHGGQEDVLHGGGNALDDGLVGLGVVGLVSEGQDTHGSLAQAADESQTLLGYFRVIGKPGTEIVLQAGGNPVHDGQELLHLLLALDGHEVPGREVHPGGGPHP